MIMASAAGLSVNSLGGKSLREVLAAAGSWSPGRSDVSKVRDLAASLTSLGAT